MDIQHTVFMTAHRGECTAQENAQRNVQLAALLKVNGFTVSGTGEGHYVEDNGPVVEVSLLVPCDSYADARELLSIANMFQQECILFNRSDFASLIANDYTVSLAAMAPITDITGVDCYTVVDGITYTASSI